MIIYICLFFSRGQLALAFMYLYVSVLKTATYAFSVFSMRHSLCLVEKVFKSKDFQKEFITILGHFS